MASGQDFNIPSETARGSPGTKKRDSWMPLTCKREPIDQMTIDLALSMADNMPNAREMPSKCQRCIFAYGWAQDVLHKTKEASRTNAFQFQRTTHFIVRNYAVAGRGGGGGTKCMAKRVKWYSNADISRNNTLCEELWISTSLFLL